MQLAFHGCVSWRTAATDVQTLQTELEAYSHDGADLILGIAAAPVDIPSSNASVSSLFNESVALALTDGASTEQLRRDMMHALAAALGAKELQRSTDPDVQRGSLMSADPARRSDWLDEANRMEILRRKTWPFRHEPSAMEKTP